MHDKTHKLQSIITDINSLILENRRIRTELAGVRRDVEVLRTMRALTDGEYAAKCQRVEDAETKAQACSRFLERQKKVAVYRLLQLEKI